MSIWGPIVAAIIAAVLGALSLIIAKQNKTSEFRQEWINEFRDEISLLVQAYTQYLGAKETYGRDRKQCKITKFEKSGELHRYRSKIILRLNANTDKRTIHEKGLANSIYKVVYNPEKQKSVDIIGEIYKYSGAIFKDEWERVKRGEKFYRYILILFSIISLIAIFIVFCAVQSHWDDITMLLMNIPHPNSLPNYTAQ